jgi:hypothetical protein
MSLCNILKAVAKDAAASARASGQEGAGVQAQQQGEHGEGAPPGGAVAGGDQLDDNGVPAGGGDDLRQQGGGGGGGDRRQQEGVVEQPGESSGDINGSISNDNFSEIVKEEGTKVFECNVCNEVFDQPSKVRRHITLKHIKPANEMRAKQATPGGKRSREEELDLFENKKHKFVFSESILDEFDRTGKFVTSTQVEKEINSDNEEDELTDKSSLEVTVVRARPDTVDQALVIINDLERKVKELEEEQKLSKNKIVSQDIIISTKQDALLVLQGTANSLEDENKKHEVRNYRLEKVIATMKGEIVHLREVKAGDEKTKKLIKELKEAENKVNDNIKKVEELVIGKAKAEAELVRMTKVCDFQMKALEVGDQKDVTATKAKESVIKDVMKVDIKCRQFETFAKCEYGEACKYIHPSAVCEYYDKMGKCPMKDCKLLHRVSASTREMVDCYFWMNGSCKYSATDCNKGRHAAEKFGTNKRRDSFLVPGLAGRVSASQQGMGSYQSGMGGNMSVMGGQYPVVEQQQGMVGQRKQLGVGGQQLGVMGQQHGMMGHLPMMVGQQPGMAGQQSGMLGQQLGMVGHQPGLVGPELGQQRVIMGPQQEMLGQEQRQGMVWQKQSTMGMQQQQQQMRQEQSGMGQVMDQGVQQKNMLMQQQYKVDDKQPGLVGHQQGGLPRSQQMGLCNFQQVGQGNHFRQGLVQGQGGMEWEEQQIGMTDNLRVVNLSMPGGR